MSIRTVLKSCEIMKSRRAEQRLWTEPPPELEELRDGT